jgi:hypothetical protein
MNRRKPRILLAVLVLAVSVVVNDGVAAAVPCGSVDPDTQRTARAALTLDEDSVTTLVFKRHTEPRTLLIRFIAAGCDLGGQTDPGVSVLPKQGANEIPDGVVSSPPTVEMDTSELSLRLRIDPTKFYPDTYGGVVEVRAPYLVTSRVPISISRSEHREWIPGLIGFLAGFVGALWLFLLKLAGGVKASKVWIAVVLLAGAAVGAFAVLSSYWDQDVWSLDANLRAAIVAGIAGASTGAAAAMLGVIYTDKKS